MICLSSHIVLFEIYLYLSGMKEIFEVLVCRDTKIINCWLQSLLFSIYNIYNEYLYSVHIYPILNKWIFYRYTLSKSKMEHDFNCVQQNFNLRVEMFKRFERRVYHRRNAYHRLTLLKFNGVLYIITTKYSFSDLIFCSFKLSLKWDCHSITDIAATFEIKQFLLIKLHWKHFLQISWY